MTHSQPRPEHQVQTGSHPPETCLAAVFHAPGVPLELRRFPLPASLAAGEILVKVTCCTLCGSDLSTLAGHRQEPVPCILGHEIVGTVAAIGGGDLRDLRGRSIRIGDRLVWSVIAACGHCRRCRRGLPQKCSQLKKYGHQRVTPDWQLSGGLAEYCHLIGGTRTLILEPGLPDPVLCTAACAIATVAAALRAAERVEGQRVLILGAGLLGLTASAMARVWRADSITVCDPDATRLAWASQFAADHTVPWERFAQDHDDHRFDLVLEMSGNSQALARGLAVAEVGARIVLVGSVHPAPVIEIVPQDVVRRLLTLVGVHNYHPDDLLCAVDFLTTHGTDYPFAQIISPAIQLANINTVLQAKSQSRTVRIAVRP